MDIALALATALAVGTTPSPGVSLDVFQARDAIARLAATPQGSFDRRTGLGLPRHCPGDSWVNASFSVSLSFFAVECGGGGVKFEFAQTPEPRLESGWRTLQLFARATDGRELPISFYGEGKEERQTEFLVAWRVLAVEQAVGTGDDVTFATLLAKPGGCAESATPTEEVVRFRVQAERAVREGRLGDATRHYRDAVVLAPCWAAGRYNLALLLAEQGLRRAARLEFQRYLRLAPDAPNAQAVRHKIYELEAVR